MKTNILKTLAENLTIDSKVNPTEAASTLFLANGIPANRFTANRLLRLLSPLDIRPPEQVFPVMRGDVLDPSRVAEIRENQLSRARREWEHHSAHFIQSVYIARTSQQGYLFRVQGMTATARALRRILAKDMGTRELLKDCTRADAYREAAPEPFINKLRNLNLTPESFRYERAVGVEIETFGEVDPRTLEQGLPIWARVASDASIRADVGQGHEIRALFTRSEMEPRLFRLCKTLEAFGLKVNKSCGLHVHFDMRGRTEAEVKAIATRANKWLLALQQLVPVSRRTNQYCEFGISFSNRYRAVNCCAFRSHRTLEIRLHSATLSYTKVLAWIRLCELILALKKGPSAADCIGTLAQLPLAEHDLAYWRKRHADLNPRLYDSASTTEGRTE